jgi:hypothetical protein
MRDSKVDQSENKKQRDLSEFEIRAIKIRDKKGHFI